MISLNQESNLHNGLSLRGISKRFGRDEVLCNVDLDIRPGELTLLLGQNGSGKSTLLRICAGLSSPDSGTLTHTQLGSIGYVGHQCLLYGALTVRENLQLVARLLRVEDDVPANLNDWGLASYADNLVSELSKGIQFRAALARVFIQSPKVVLLDEPTAALDERTTTLLFEKLRALLARPEPPSVVVATHDLARAAGYAQRAIVLSQGAIAYDSAKIGSIEAALQHYREINR